MIIGRERGLTSIRRAAMDGAGLFPAAVVGPRERIVAEAEERDAIASVDIVLSVDAGRYRRPMV